MLLAGCGASLGALIRYLLTILIKKLPINWPLATLIINLSGAFLLGILTHHLANEPALLLFWGVGVLGGYTTFSTFNVELVSLIDEKRWLSLILYLLLTYVGGIGLAIVGLIL